MPFGLRFLNGTPPADRKAKEAKEISERTKGLVSEEVVRKALSPSPSRKRHRIPYLHKGGGKTRKRNRRTRRR